MNLVQSILAEICHLLRQNRTQDAPVTSELAILLVGLERILALSGAGGKAQEAAEASPLAVCRYWAQALQLAANTPGEKLAESLRSYTNLRWLQNPNYLTAEPSPGFLQNYGYVEFVGQRGVMQSSQLAAGILLLGPHTFYPPHAHAASEIYFIVAGHAQWQQSEQGWVTQPPGSYIFHAPRVVHATQTNDEPLLALYLWHGAVEQAATIVNTTENSHYRKSHSA